MIIRPRRDKRNREARLAELRNQYKKQVGPLRLFLLLECAPLIIDPLEVADEAFARAFAQPDRVFTYCDIRKIAEEVVREKRTEAGLQVYADYKLEEVFDEYLTEDLQPVREVLRAIDGLSLGERRAVEAQLIHLLTCEGLTEAVGGAAATRRGQKAKGLAKLTQADVNVDLLEPFFSTMRGACNGQQDG
ncbi:hypothetical protein ACF09J_32650 [Streptomyces sp. NPDC014889]|uniref:hypothetical protein n=1 Tax=Streptomyces sp. NPDC014889 TaxID=3364928 RepID=UPI0036FE6827